jgi:hypothetical protein
MPIISAFKSSTPSAARLAAPSANSPLAADRGGARVEVQAAALGRDRDAQGVPREERLGRAAVNRRRLPPGPAVLALAVDLHHALPGGEVPGRRDLLDEGLDIGAQELGRLVAGLADQVKVPRVAVGVFEPEAAFAKIDFPRDTRVYHPLQRAVDGGATDALVFASGDVEEIVGAEVSLLLEEHIQNQVAFARPLGASGPEPLDVGDGGAHARDVTRDREDPSAVSDATRR